MRISADVILSKSSVTTLIDSARRALESMQSANIAFFLADGENFPSFNDRNVYLNRRRHVVIEYSRKATEHAFTIIKDNHFRNQNKQFLEQEINDIGVGLDVAHMIAEIFQEKRDSKEPQGPKPTAPERRQEKLESTDLELHTKLTGKTTRARCRQTDRFRKMLLKKMSLLLPRLARNNQLIPRSHTSDSRTTRTDENAMGGNRYWKKFRIIFPAAFILISIAAFLIWYFLYRQNDADYSIEEHNN